MESTTFAPHLNSNNPSRAHANIIYYVDRFSYHSSGPPTRRAVAASLSAPSADRMAMSAVWRPTPDTQPLAWRCRICLALQSGIDVCPSVAHPFGGAVALSRVCSQTSTVDTCLHVHRTCPSGLPHFGCHLGDCAKHPVKKISLILLYFIK